MLKSTFTFLFLLLLLLVTDVNSQTREAVILKDGLVVKLERRGIDQIISPNAVAASVETGKWKTPSENEELKFNNKTAGIWKKIESDENGWFEGELLVNSYVDFSYESQKDEIVLLEGMGNTMVYVNGTARSGNPYRYQDEYESWGPRFDYSLVPVKMNK